MAGKSRSPNYPAMGLPSALDLAASFWKREGRTQVPADVAAKALGFRSMSGSAKVALGAMNQYGLVDRSKKMVKLSDLAIRILHPENDEAKMRALREAAFMPELFGELKETHAQASDDAIRAYLIGKKQFGDRGAGVFISAFRDTLSLVYPNGEAYNEPSMGSQEPASHSFESRFDDGTAKSGLLSLMVPYGGEGKQLQVQIRVTGERLKKSHIDKVRRYLELAADDLTDVDDAS